MGGVEPWNPMFTWLLILLKASHEPAPQDTRHNILAFAGFLAEISRAQVDGFTLTLAIIRQREEIISPYFAGQKIDKTRVDVLFFRFRIFMLLGCMGNGWWWSLNA